MSIVKDLLLISIFLYVVIKYILLLREFQKEREYFINTLSHDLRVSAIAQIRALEILERNSFSAHIKELIAGVNESCKFSLEMINMLLASYRFENKEEVLSYKVCNINDLVVETIEKYSRELNAKNLYIKNRFFENCFAQIDKDGIEKVLSTLISTAIFYSNPNSKIITKTKECNNNLIFSVLYRGQSISEEEYRRMFKKKCNFSTVGQGIKMFLCKKIIDFHKGKIFIKNFGDDLNKFTFTIPIYNKKQNVKTPLFSVIEPYNMQKIN